MFRCTIIISLFISLISYESWGQNAKKESIAAFRAITRLDISEIKKGQHLEFAYLYPVKQFIEYTAEFGKRDTSKKWGPTTIEQVFRDSAFTYFVRANESGSPMNFFRVKNDELTDLDYSEFDGKAVKDKFIAEVVPGSDKERVERKEKNIGMGFYRGGFRYNYQPETKLLEITYRWKITGDFQRIINKTYNAKYDLNTRQFKDISRR